VGADQLSSRDFDAYIVPEESTGACRRQSRRLNGWLAQLENGLPFASIAQGFLAADEFYKAAVAHS